MDKGTNYTIKEDIDSMQLGYREYMWMLIQILFCCCLAIFIFILKKLQGLFLLVLVFNNNKIL